MFKGKLLLRLVKFVRLHWRCYPPRRTGLTSEIRAQLQKTILQVLSIRISGPQEARPVISTPLTRQVIPSILQTLQKPNKNPLAPRPAIGNHWRREVSQLAR